MNKLVYQPKEKKIAKQNGKKKKKRKKGENM
jgi:hypothetical protein